MLERARDVSELHARHGWELAGAFTTAMANDHEALLLWAIPTWQHWADGEGDRDLRGGGGASARRPGSASCSSTRRCARSGPAANRYAPTASTGMTDGTR